MGSCLSAFVMALAERDQASVGDRVVVYHIAGCGVCEECRHGYMIGCTSPLRAAHGWQRDGAHAEFLLAAEATCILLPDELSYVGGALTPTCTR